MSRGLLITVEGTDGAGKSTQINFIREYFKEKGIETIFVREPGSTVIGEKIREILLDKDNQSMSYRTEMFLYAAARAQLVEEVIEPAILENKVVICDRFIDSSMAYQGYGRQLGEDVADVNRHALKGISPDLTIFIDVNVKVGQKRVDKLEREIDRIESQSDEFHKRVVEGYRKIAEKNSDRIKTVTGNQEIDKVSLDIKKYLDELMKKAVERGRLDEVQL